MAFDNFISPSLPMPPKDYSFEYFNQLVRALQTYFRVLDSRALINVAGITSDLIRTPMYELTITSGEQNNLSIPVCSFLRIASAGGAFTITGIANASDGRMLTIFNSTSSNMTIANQSSASSDANRILTCTGSDIVFTGQGVVNLIYSIKDSRWIVTSTQG